MAFLRSLIAQWLSVVGLKDSSHGLGYGDDTSGTDGVEAMIVDDLNKRYRDGKPSNDYGEIGFFLRIIDGVCNPYADPPEPCNHNMADVPVKAFFGGTVEGPNDVVTASYNDMINTPKSMNVGGYPVGDVIPIFPSWVVGYGPAAGLIYFSCAAEKGTRCMWPTDGASDSRPLSCGRIDFHKDAPKWLAIDACRNCFNEAVLDAEDNSINGRAIHYMDDLPTEANLTSCQIELLFNRHNIKNVENSFETSGRQTQTKNLSSSCHECQSAAYEKLGKERADYFNQENYRRSHWYEGPGYYGSLTKTPDESSLIDPRNELKKMLEVQAAHFGPNHDLPQFPPGLAMVWNEYAMDGNIINDLEVDRELYEIESNDFSGGNQDDVKKLNLEGDDESGICGAAIKALVMICGVEDDPFYFGTPGTCLDLAEAYKQNFGTEKHPPVVYMDPKNFTHPFSSTCNTKSSCGAVKQTSLRSAK